MANKTTMVDILSANTGQTVEKLTKDMDRMLYLTPYQAQEYGIIDTILESSDALPAALAAQVRA